MNFTELEKLGSAAALAYVGLNKQAWVGQAVRQGLNAARQAAPEILPWARKAVPAAITGAKQVPGKTMDAIGSAGTRAEQALVSKLPSNMQSTAGKVLAGTGKNVAQNAAIGASLGGAVEGGIGALSAPEGERGKAFLEGAAHGAAGGAVGGAVQGALTPAWNGLSMGQKQLTGLRQSGMDRLHSQGLGTTLKQVVMGGHAGRGGAATEVARRGTQLAGDWVVPGMVAGAMPYALGGNSEMPKEASFIPPALIGSMGGSLLGGLGADAVMQGLEAKGVLPKGLKNPLARSAVRGASALGTGLTGYGTINALTDHPDLAQHENLNKIDMDKLLADYSKSESIGS